jgi:hypothetical protein
MVLLLSYFSIELTGLMVDMHCAKIDHDQADQPHRFHGIAGRS